MAEYPAMPLWTDAYLADTRHLSRDQHGAYLLLLMEAWRRPSCSLPDNDELLARLAQCSPEEWPSIKPVVMQFWTLCGRTCEWTQKRLTKERKFVDKNRQQKRDAAAKRWKKRKNNNAAAYPHASQPHMQPTPTPIPYKSPSTTESPNARAREAGNGVSGPFLTPSLNEQFAARPDSQHEPTEASRAPPPKRGRASLEPKSLKSVLPTVTPKRQQAKGLGSRKDQG